MPGAEWVKIASDWLQFGVAGAAGGAIAIWASLGRRDSSLASTLAALRADLDTRLSNVMERLTRIEAGGVPAGQCASHIARIVALETAGRTGVTHDDIARAHHRMDVFEGQVGRMTGLLEGISHSMDRLETHMMQHGPRAGD